jgi:hypothetical protein
MSVHERSEEWFASFVQQRWTSLVRFAYTLTLDEGRAEDVGMVKTQASRGVAWLRAQLGDTWQADAADGVPVPARRP